MKLILLFTLLLFASLSVSGQRKLPKQSKELRVRQKQEQRQESRTQKPKDDRKWLQREIPGKSKGVPVVSSWHTGTAGIIASDAAELSLFNPSRIGFSRSTELLFRIAEEPFLPNFGLKHRWWGNDRFILSTEHTLYYTYPLLKILQNTGTKDLIPDTVRINHGFAMRNELIFSWLMNPRVFGCPDLRPERILSLRAGVEFYAGIGLQQVQPFDWFHSLYHTQILAHKPLYYGGLQFDSYFSSRFHYSVNVLYYNVDLSSEYAVEGNARLTYYISRRIGISASCKFAYMDIADKTQMTFLPLLDVTFLIHPDRGEIRHGLFKNPQKRR